MMADPDLPAPRRHLTLSDYQRDMDRFYPERELGDSGTYFQDARGSSDSESDSYDDGVIEEADTDAIAPVVLATPKSRFQPPQPENSLPSTDEIPPASTSSLDAINAIVPLKGDVGSEDKPSYPSLDDAHSEPSQMTPSEYAKPASSGWFSWFGSFFGSNTPDSGSKPSSPGPALQSASSSTTTLSNQGTSSLSSSTPPQTTTNTASTPIVVCEPKTSNIAATQLPNGSVPNPPQAQTINYIIINGHSDNGHLPPQVQQLVDTLSRTQLLPNSSYAPPATNFAPVPSTVPATGSGFNSIPPPPQMGGGPPPPPSGGPPPPPPPPSSSSDTSMDSTYMETSPSPAPASPSSVTPSITPALATITPAERKAKQKAAREAERANQMKQSWVEILRQIVEVCDRLSPGAKQEAIQYWIAWYDTNIPYANLLTLYYYPLLQNIPKQFELIQNALNFWEKSLFEQLGEELNIDAVAVNELRKRRCVSLCDNEVKWFRAKDKTQDSINDERTKLLEASFTYCSTAIRQERQRLDQNKLQDELADKLSKIRAKTSEAEEPIEFDE